MRLIDADAYAEEMKKRQDACKEWTQRTIDTVDEENYLRSCGAYVAFVEAKLLLEKQPTIDAVEVVHCKECKYWRQQTNYAGARLSFGFCESEDMWRSLYGETYEVSHIDTDDDFYCGYAERREE